jgi:hypothetical protein
LRFLPHCRIDTTDPSWVTDIRVTLAFEDRPAQPEPEEGFFFERYEGWYSASFPGVNRARTTAFGYTAQPMTQALRSGGQFSLRHGHVWTFGDGTLPEKGCAWCVPQVYDAAWTGGIRLEAEISYTSRPLRSVWGANDGCHDPLETLGSDFCSGTVECPGSPPLAADGCYENADVRVCPDAMAAPPVAGQNPFCTEIKVTASCSGFNQGRMSCWTDPQGELQCPYNDGDQPSDCIALEADPACGFIKSECVEGAVDNRGICFLFEETWDCGTARTIPVLERNRTLDCAGPVRCLGTDCAEFPEEQSADFAKAVGALQTVQMAVSDMQCTPGGSCRVFSGSGHECKRAVEGIVNCCTRPQAVSLADYVGLIFALGKIDAAIMGLNKGAMIRGSWETLRQPVTATWARSRSPSSASPARPAMPLDGVPARHRRGAADHRRRRAPAFALDPQDREARLLAVDGDARDGDRDETMGDAEPIAGVGGDTPLCRARWRARRLPNRHPHPAGPGEPARDQSRGTVRSGAGMPCSSSACSQSSASRAAANWGNSGDAPTAAKSTALRHRSGSTQPLRSSCASVLIRERNSVASWTCCSLNIWEDPLPVLSVTASGNSRRITRRCRRRSPGMPRRVGVSSASMNSTSGRCSNGWTTSTSGP